jgi:hypothetical protein
MRAGGYVRLLSRSPMMAAVSVMVASVGESSFGQWCGKAAVIDCAIPIALIIALIISGVLV